MIAWRTGFLVSVILVLKSCNFFPYVSFKKRRNYTLWRGIISVRPSSFYGFRVANILNEILLSNLLLPSWLNHREQSFLKLCQMRIAFWIDSENLFPKMYAKETVIFFFDHMPLSFIILLIRIIVISPYKINNQRRVSCLMDGLQVTLVWEPVPFRQWNVNPTILYISGICESQEKACSWKSFSESVQSPDFV